MPDVTAQRRYSDAEEAAFRACGMNPMYGPAQFAGGPYWPDELDRRADRLEALIPHLRLAAAALRREIEADPLTAAGVADSPQEVTYQEALLEGADPNEGFYE